MDLRSSHPDLMHPFASAIDTDLSKPPEHNHIMLDFAASWVRVPDGPDEHHYQCFPDESLLAGTKGLVSPTELDWTEVNIKVPDGHSL